MKVYDMLGNEVEDVDPKSARYQQLAHMRAQEAAWVLFRRKPTLPPPQHLRGDEYRRRLMSKCSPHITVRLPPALKASVEAMAQREGVTVTSLVVRALWGVVGDQEPRSTP